MTTTAPIFRSLDQHTGDVAAGPSKFFEALDHATKRAADVELEREAFAVAVGFYDCPCGGEYEFAEDSTLEEYAGLNRWLGRHVPCSEVEAVRLAHDNDMLRHQAGELLTRVQELTAEDDAKAELIGELRAELDEYFREQGQLKTDLARARGERNTFRAAADAR